MPKLTTTMVPNVSPAISQQPSQFTPRSRTARSRFLSALRQGTRLTQNMLLTFSSVNAAGPLAMPVAILFSSSLLLAQADQKPIPEVPVLAEASDEAEKAISTFKVPTGLTCELFAAEPLVGNPVAFTFDRFGKLFVCETYRQVKAVTDNRGQSEDWLNADLAAMSVADRIRYHRELLGEKAAEFERYDDLIRVLEDTDSDGKADKQTVFASGFNSLEEGTGAGVLVHDDTVYFTNIPKLWALKDSNKDGVADEKIVLSDGYGVRVAFRGHDLHGLIMGPDGRLYYSIGDRGYNIQTKDGNFVDAESGAVFRCDLDGSNLEIVATGLRNPQELAFDDEGNLFTGDNNSDSGDKARWIHLVHGGDAGWRMMYQYLPDRGYYNREQIWKPYQENVTPAYILPPIENIADGPSGLICYSGVGLDGSEVYKNNFFLCDFRGQPSNSGIRRIQLEPKGATFAVEKNEQFIWNILATDIETAPDGSLFVSDWVMGWEGLNKGRIYKFASKSEEVLRHGKHSEQVIKTGFSKLSVNELVVHLASEDRRIRLGAQWELAKRKQTDALVKVLHSGKTRNEKLHAIWGLGQIVRMQEDVAATAALIAALTSKDEYVVARACDSLAEGKTDFPVGTLQQLISHQSPVVRRQALLAVARTGAAIVVDEIAKVIVENADQDPILRHAAIMALAKVLDNSSVPRWIQHPNESVRVSVAVALRRAKNPSIALMLKDSSVRVLREVARAIYDVPELNSQLDDLAALPISPEFDDGLIERILHANYRIGESRNIERLISFASSSIGNEAKRIEALQLLQNWKSPGLRDKLLNRHQPLADRPTDEVIKQLHHNVAALSATSDNVRDAFFKLGASYGLTEIADQLINIVQDDLAEPGRRADSILALSSLNPNFVLENSDRLLADKQVTVRTASLRALVSLFQGKQATEKVVKAVTNGLKSEITAERQAAWDAISSLDDSSALELLNQYASSLFDRSMPKDTWLNAQEAIVTKGSETLKGQWREREAELKSLADSNPAEAWADCIEGGDPVRGHELFFTRSSLSCVRCHKVGNVGGDVGPSLSSLGKLKDATYLLEAIVAPNKAIAEGFETIIVLTEDDETFSGIVQKETDTSLSIMDAQGAVVEIKKSEIVDRRKGLSSMPADLVQFLSRRELRDLVAYLASLDGTETALKPYANVTGQPGHGGK